MLTTMSDFRERALCRKTSATKGKLFSFADSFFHPIKRRLGRKDCGKLLDIGSKYLASRSISVAYAKNILRTLRRAKDAGITPDNICGERVNTFLASLSSASPASRANARRELLCIWRFGYELGQIATPPERVMRVRVARQPTEAWSLGELREIHRAAQEDNTPIGGVHSMPVCAYLPAWISIGYDTGLRHGDLYTLHRQEIRNGMVYRTARKTGKVLARRLSSGSLLDAQRLIEASPDGYLFSWFITRRRWFVVFRDFLDRHQFRGTSQWLRRSCATYLAQESRGLASRYLQHSSERLLDHYVDESLLDCPPGPPPIN